MKSLIMSAPMVRAVLNGRKTVTRRVIKRADSGRVKEVGGHRNWHLDDANAVLACPFQPGETIYIREAWLARRGPVIIATGTPQPGDTIIYRADQKHDLAEVPWRSPIHMPEWASRIKLRITSVNAERLQDISAEDALAEGVLNTGRRDGAPYAHYKFPGAEGMGVRMDVEPESVYAALWDSLNAARGYSWESNPWVWRIQFERIEAEQ